MGPPAQSPAGAQAPTGSAVISGVVIDGATSQPLADALVSLDTGGAPSGGLQTRELTDSNGRFAFVNLPGSEAYTVVATRAGYLDAGYSRFDSYSTPIFLRDDEWFGTAKIVMWRPGAITGTVMDERGEPLAGVFVRVLGEQQIAGRTQLAVGPILTTDDRGLYRAAGLRPGRYLVEVPDVQSSVPAATTPALIAGQGLSPNLKASSTGRPGEGAPVETALDLDPRARLMVGRYPTPPPPADGQRLAYAMTFYSTATAIGQAAAVELTHGEERGGIDVRIEPVAVSNISGVVQGPADAIANLTLRLVPAGMEDLGYGSESATALVAPDGSFVFLNVPAGAYTIDVPLGMGQFSLSSSFSFEGPQLPKWPGTSGSGQNSGSVPSAPQGTSFSSFNNRPGSGPGSHYWAHQAITVNGRDASNVVVALHAGVNANGRIVLEYDPNKPNGKAPAYYSLKFDPASGRAGLGMPGASPPPDPATGEFEVADLRFGQYFLRVTAGGWIVKSIVCGGHDFTNAAFDTTSGADFNDIVVTLTNAVGSVSGVVLDAHGAAATMGTVIAFPTDPAAWTDYGLMPTRIRTAGVSNTGAYRLAGLPAGDYLIVALEGARPDEWHNPEFFKKAQGFATRVSVAWGEPKTVDIKTVEVR